MIFLPSKYYLVVNDRFELFFRGVIKKHNPYQYYVKAECEKGYTYNRYFTFTPKKEDIKVTKQTTEKEEEQPKKRTSKTRRTKKNNDQGVK